MAGKLNVPRSTLFQLTVLFLGTGIAVALSPTARLRAGTSDFEYNLALDEFTESWESGIHTSRTLNSSTAPILSMPDIQSSMQFVKLEGNKEYPIHSHPRGSELVYVERGNLTVLLLFGNRGKLDTAKNSFGSHGVAIIPQGITHMLQCESKDGCAYVSYYNSASPGRA